MRLSSSSAFVAGSDMPALSAPVHNHFFSPDANISFRRGISASELDLIRQLHSEWFPVDYSEDFFLSLTNPLEEVLTVVALSDSLIVGMSTVAVRRSERRYNFAGDLFGDNEGKDNIAYILTLGVIDELRRRGIATQLLSETEKAIRAADPHCSAILLHVIEYNKSAMRLYQRSGYRRVKDEPRFYKLGDQWFSGILFYKPVNEALRRSTLGRMIEWVRCRFAMFFRRFITVPTQETNFVSETV
jgi:ribosomal protein S18 acetylase RimI-like enzyme